MKIIRNIDGKKLELTLTNEEAMSVFMDVFLTRTNSRIVQRTDCSAEETEFSRSGASRIFLPCWTAKEHESRLTLCCSIWGSRCRTL